MSARQETLAQACAPVFLFLTSFRRNAATSSMGIQELSQALQRDLDGVRAHCEQDRRLHPLFERCFYALVATADQVVLSSSWPQRAGWSMNLLETRYFGTSQGGKKFYAFVEEIANDPTAEAAELAEVLFTCMGIGFQGELLGERRELERRRLQLYEKARLPGALGEVLCPGAYGRNAAKDLTRLPTVGIAGLALVALGAILFALLAGNAATSFKNRETARQLEEVLDALERR